MGFKGIEILVIMLRVVSNKRVRVSGLGMRVMVIIPQEWRIKWKRNGKWKWNWAAFIIGRSLQPLCAGSDRVQQPLQQAS